VKDRPELEPRRRPARGQATLRPGQAADRPSTAPPPSSTLPPTTIGTSFRPPSREDGSIPPSLDPLGATAASPAPQSSRGRASAREADTHVTTHEPVPGDGAERGRRAKSSSTSSARPADSWASSPHSSRASRDEAAADPLVGLVVADRYRIVEPIGRGGMGIVYRVEHVRIGKLLAMKLLAGELSSNKEIVRRFKQEALTASKLSSPFTVQVFDYGVWQHLTFLVMELVEGVDLSRALRRAGPLPFPRLGRLMVQVCSSLAEAHQKGIVHRDIKPENVMLVSDEAGRESAKVVDFGLAKLRESSELNEVTIQGTVVGTPYYMSPEQILGEEVDGRTDVYSLGAVMYRMLTGSYPFTANTPIAMFTKHLNEAPPEIARTHPELGVPKGVSDAVLRCLSKKKDERFESIEELHDVLAEELRGLGVASDRDPPEVTRDGDGSRHRRGGDAEIATREELEAYEATLRRNRYGISALLGAVVLGAAGTVAGLGFGAKTSFRGEETEPNDNSGTASVLPFGEAVRGTIGRRIDENTGDQDVFRLTVPASTRAVHLRLDPLPTFGLCASVHRLGFEHATSHYCTGPLGAQPLDLPAVRLEAGDYLIVVRQDRAADASQKLATPIHENISDGYRLSLGASDDGAADVEPNDGIEGATPLAPGAELQGSLGFTDDVDVVCSTESNVAFVVDDPERRFGTVLEVTPRVGESPMPLVRVHASRAVPHSSRTRMAADVNGPWKSPPCAASRCCVELRLTRDPWAHSDAVGPRPDETRYWVRVERGGSNP